MSRKDFELIASAIRDTRYGFIEQAVALGYIGSQCSQRALDQVVENLIRSLAKENIRFDAMRFKAACQLGAR
jgi:hypothetical protein